MVSDKVCLGNGNPYTTVCLDDQRFYAVTEITELGWLTALKEFDSVDTIFGLGFAEPEENSLSFVAKAVHLGVLNENIYALQMASYQSIQKLGVDSSNI